MRGGEAQREECERSHVETAVVRVPVGHVGLPARKAGGEEAAFVEILPVVEHAVQDCREGTPHLGTRHACGQLVIPGHEGQWLHGGHAVGDGAAEHGESAFGRDEAFEDEAVFLGTLQGAGMVFGIVDARIGTNYVLV